MPKAVQLSAYGGVEQVHLVDVPKPEPKAGEVVVRVVAAGTNPGEISIREGLLKDIFPMGRDDRSRRRARRCIAAGRCGDDQQCGGGCQLARGPS